MDECVPGIKVNLLSHYSAARKGTVFSINYRALHGYVGRLAPCLNTRMLKAGITVRNADENKWNIPQVGENLSSDRNTGKQKS